MNTIDPKKHIITFGGVPITGFSEDFLNVEPSGQRFTKRVGADGEVARGKSNDKTHTVTLTLLATSASNAVFSASLLTDQVLPLSIVDLNGSVVFFWPEAWVQTGPTVTRGVEVGDQEWILDTGQIASEILAGTLVPDTAV